MIILDFLIYFFFSRFNKIYFYHKKLLAYLKLGPQVAISWIRSSTQVIPVFPNF
jgi:hypothetical protein